MSDGGLKNKRRKTSKFYKKQQYRQQNQQRFLEPGLKGFMVTCNYREKDCVRECYNLLNEYAEPIVEKEEPKQENIPPKESANSDEIQIPSTENGSVSVNQTNPNADAPENENGSTTKTDTEDATQTDDKKSEENAEQTENKEKTGEITVEESKTETPTTEKINEEENVGDEAESDGSEDTDEDDDEEEEEDISTQLENQIKTLNDPKKVNRKRFKQVDTKTMNCLFVNCSVDDPMELGLKIVRDIAATKVQKSRFILRFLPIEVVCKATLEDIKDAAGKLFDKYFLNTTPKTFSIVVNKRFNNSVERMKVIRQLAEMITFKNVLHKVNLKNPQYSVVVEVNKGLCCLTVLPDYMQLKKYNLTELIKVEPTNGAELNNTDAVSTTDTTENETLNV